MYLFEVENKFGGVLQVLLPLVGKPGHRSTIQQSERQFRNKLDVPPCMLIQGILHKNYDLMDVLGASEVSAKLYCHSRTSVL